MLPCTNANKCPYYALFSISACLMGSNPIGDAIFLPFYAENNKFQRIFFALAVCPHVCPKFRKIKKRGSLPAIDSLIKINYFFCNQFWNIPRSAPVKPYRLARFSDQLRQLSRLQTGAIRYFAEFFCCHSASSALNAIRISLVCLTVA